MSKLLKFFVLVMIVIIFGLPLLPLQADEYAAYEEQLEESSEEEVGEEWDSSYSDSDWSDYDDSAALEEDTRSGEG